VRARHRAHGGDARIHAVERGDADQSSDEQDILYETYPDLVDLATDLFNMVSRRDERIVELEREVQAYAEAEAGASL
jgi:hypothetical protein